MTVTALHPAGPAPAAPSMVAAAPLAEVVYEPAPAGAPADAPRVFAAINGVMRDAMPVGKDQKNTHQNYNFRGIDDVMSAMAGPMRTHGVFILPTIAVQQQDRDGKVTRTLIKMRYRIYGPAGDCLIAEVPGEAFDTADKSMNKAMSAALKYLLFMLFMLPVDGRSIDDGDRDHPVQPTEQHRAERQQNQQRRHQRQQNNQQRNQRPQQDGQQPRRSNRAEPGPWEQQAPAQQQRRDYLAEARRADNPHQFAKIRAAAVENGAPPEFVAQLDQIAAEKRQAAQQQPHTPAGPSPHSVSDAVGAEGAVGAAPADDGYRAGPDADEQDAERAAAEAENRLRVAASKANLPTLDRDFEMVFGLPIAQAPAAQLNLFRERIEAAGGDQ
ncbi:ERF family protein [Streptomyces sp. WAC01490]|uniref:ERF family protein n=1 Tax=unclassified Streptomyces TaxID=2593676 RepID=UPI003F3D3E82